MRLQLSIYRHTLPPCHILFSTGSGPASQTASRLSTISDLLTDVNALVPLESDDGEWGLEDYVVEVAATLEQGQRYECLHFCELKKVLREDDEVVIRGLSLDELRERRNGKRFQISEDGRHLVDGVGWGKKWVRAQMKRPGMKIPGRKKRRLLVNSADEETEEAAWDTPAHLQIKNEDDLDQDDQDDGDYEDNIPEDGAQLQILARQDFEDADEDSEQDSDQSLAEEDLDSVLDEDIDADELAGLLEDVKNELLDANADLARVEEANVTSLQSIKRKRDATDDGEDFQDESEFEGFASPIAVRGVALTDLQVQTMFQDFSTSTVAPGVAVNENLEDRPEFHAASSSESSSSDSESESESDSEIELEGPPPATATALAEYDGSSDARDDQSDDPDGEDEGPQSERIILGNFAEPEWEDTSSSLEESSEDESEDDSDLDEDSISENVKDAQDLPASLGDFAEFEQESATSSSGESSTDDDTDSDEVSTTSGLDDLDDANSSSSDSVSASEDELKSKPTSRLQNVMSEQPPKLTQVAPGNGLPNTHLRNSRLKKRTRLRALKADGRLPSDANFAALQAYDLQQEEIRVQSVLEVQETLPEEQPQEDVDEKKRELLELLETKGDPMDRDISASNDAPASFIDGVTDDRQPGSSMNLVVDNDEAVPYIDAIGHDSDSNKENQATAILPKTATPVKGLLTDAMETKSEPAKPRSRLDLASSRRLLFGSLGLRNPKTLEAEQALRERLSQSVRKNQFKAAGDESKKDDLKEEQINKVAGKGSTWKKKLIISAKECEQEGLTLATPSFPFEQNLARGTSRLDKKKARNQDQYYQTGYDDQKYAPDVSMLEESRRGGETATVQSKTLSAESGETGDLPRPANFQILATLRHEDVVPGAVIGFKEWHINANGEPGVSDYRVAKVMGLDGEHGIISLRLSKRDRDLALRSRYDDVTGERLFSRFEAAPSDDEEEEDIGERTLAFIDLQEAKIIEASTLQVAASNEGTSMNGSGQKLSQLKDDLVLIPDSGPDRLETADSATAVKKAPNGEFEVSTPRRDEITSMIKDAGFDSALDSQLLNPIARVEDNTGLEESQELGTSQIYMADEDHENAAINTTGFESPHYNAWSSSPPKRQADDDGAADDEPSKEWPSSMLSDNTTPKAPTVVVEVQRVHYPRISQLNMAEDSILSNVENSPHQDAQLLGDIASGADVSISPSIARDANDNEQNEDLNDSLALVVPQSEDNADPDPDPSLPSSLRGGGAAENNSFLGPGLDGHASFGSDPDSDYVEKPRKNRHRGHRSSSSSASESNSDSDGDLPSISEFTSSQAIRTRAASREMRISPPMLKRKLSLRSSSGNFNVNANAREGIVKREPSPEPPLLPPPSSIKISASQQSQPLRMSQIPEVTQVVDLTMSSDPAASSESESGYGGHGTARTKSSGRAFGLGSGSGSGVGVAVGLGRKKLLVSKKAKSRV